MRHINLLLLGVCLAVASSVSFAAQDGGGPYLLGFGVNPEHVTPSFIRNNLAYMESRPFDGCGISSNTGWVLMDGPAVSYTTIANEFAPLQGLTFNHMKHNFALVWVNQPADFFDDWSVCIQNFANLARVLKETGVEGIMFDNEPYKTNLWNYPDSCKYASTKTLADYNAQARLRGQQVMDAMLAQYPQLVIIGLHGPYLSYSGTPLSIRNPNVAWANELSGPFLLGMMMNSGSGGLAADGGELYGLRTVTDFQNSYQYRKYTLPTDTGCTWIPDSFRSTYPSKCDISFGVYNGGSMTATDLKPTLINALNRCDHYVWFYVEGIDLFTAGSVPPDWDQAIKDARAAVPYRTATAPAAPSNLSANAVSSTQVNLAWTDNSSNESGFKIERKTGSAGTYAQIATAAAGATTFSDTGLSNATQFYYRVRATNSSGDSAYSNEASVTTQAASAPLPSPWQHMDVGSVGVAGNATYSNGPFNVAGSGADIWGTADAFHFVYQPLASDGQIVARVTSLENTDVWAKAGLMVRQSLTAGSQNALVTITPSNGCTFQSRATSGGTSSYTQGAAVTAPRWLKLVRSGSTLTGYQSADGATWIQVGTASVSMSGTIYFGLAVTAHNNSLIATGVYDNVVVTAAGSATPTAPSNLTATATSNSQINLAWTDNSNNETGFKIERKTGSAGTYVQIATPGAGATTYSDTGLSAGTQYYYRVRATNASGDSAFSNEASATTQAAAATLPAPWQNMDVGSVGIAGSTSYSSGTFTVKASGADIWNTADAFQFVYQPLTTDGQIVARVATLQNTDPWAKAGLMVRQSLTAGSQNVYVAMTPGNGCTLQNRTSSGGTTSYVQGPQVSVPEWIKLVRSGSTFSAYQSADGATWNSVGTATVSFSGTVYIGMAVTAHNNSVLTTATFDNVSVTTNSGGGGGAVNVKINFQPSGSPVPLTYIADTGAVYGSRGNGYTYGWNADVSSYTRDRNAANSADQRYDTLVHMQKGSVPNAVWEIAVPNGTYTVHVVAGDPSFYDSVMKIAVEGVLTVDGACTNTTRWIEGTKTVTVADGKLTVSNATGASNNKINYIDISSGAPVLAGIEEDSSSEIVKPLIANAINMFVSFVKNGADTLSVSGTLDDLPQNFKVGGATVSLDVAAAISSFTLNDKGAGKNKNGKFLMRYDEEQQKYVFAATLKKGSWAEPWGDGGLTAMIAEKLPVFIPVTLTIDGNTYGGGKELHYTSKGKVGRAN